MILSTSAVRKRTEVRCPSSDRSSTTLTVLDYSCCGRYFEIVIMSNREISLNSITKVAKELTAIEKRGGSIPSKFDFSVQAVCASCLKDIMPPKKSLRCSRCKAVIYCSSEVSCSFFSASYAADWSITQCAKRAWSHPALPNHPTHKMLCADNQV